MFRTGLLLLLLSYYLLVVGAGLVGRPEVRRPATKPYTHSLTCQLDNYLRLDCFDRCNGEAALQQHLPADSWQHVLISLKGLDVHCAVETEMALLPVVVDRCARKVGPVQGPPLTAGNPTSWPQPPRQG
ncbi:hypothetical protein [Hymenobacter sp. B81]|uniref:hypothetical protein n=1 Tax=Hymenobacter sp. B81 TaxID=3344878 RepID=UPI0037DCA7AC